MDTLAAGVDPPVRGELDAIVRRLAELRDAWTNVGPAGRASYLRRAIAAVLECSDDWVARVCAAQAVGLDSPLAGEIRLSGPVVTVRGLRLLAETLEQGGVRRLPLVHGLPGERTAVRVVPSSLFDRIVFPGIVGDVWIESDQAPIQGRLYRDKAAGLVAPGRVAVVLGAGNISSIPPLDAVHKLFAEDQVVVLKLNPVQAYLEPVFRRVFRDLIDDGFLEIVTGGADVGARLCRHPLVDTLHMTGSHLTYDAIVWGATPEEQRRRKAMRDPLVGKPFTAELGCVTPVIVVPGPWSDRDIERQAASVAGMVLHNVSFNCVAAKVLVLARGWDRRDAFVAAVRRALARLPARQAYYPGAEERYRRFLAEHPQAEPLGPSGPGLVPWTLISEVPPRAGEFALTHEAFCGVLATTDLDVADAAAFLEMVPDFANEAIWGTLSCVVLVDPDSERRHRGALDAAIERLRYGGIGVNVWTGLIFGLGVLTWGAYPGHPPEDIVSGHGAVHNGFLIDHPEKSVVRGPFRPLLKPPWHPSFRNLDALSRRMLAFEAAPSLVKLPGLAFAALGG